MPAPGFTLLGWLLARPGRLDVAPVRAPDPAVIRALATGIVQRGELAARPILGAGSLGNWPQGQFPRQEVPLSCDRIDSEPSRARGPTRR
jgi:hypothetical protein